MHYADRYRLHPTEAQQETLDYHRNTCRQLYNHALTEFEQIPQRERLTNECANSVTNSQTSKTGGTSLLSCTQLLHELP
jgi:putative transposase